VCNGGNSAGNISRSADQCSPHSASAHPIARNHLYANNRGASHQSILDE
jgi:hypothetical protein